MIKDDFMTISFILFAFPKQCPTKANLTFVRLMLADILFLVVTTMPMQGRPCRDAPPQLELQKNSKRGCMLVWSCMMHVYFPRGTILTTSSISRMEKRPLGLNVVVRTLSRPNSLRIVAREMGSSLVSVWRRQSSKPNSFGQPWGPWSPNPSVQSSSSR